MTEKINLDSIHIILVRPKFPENIGSVARAMKNMGLSRLIIVNGCSPLHIDAYKLASGAYEILERAEEFLTLKEAISDMGLVVGTTAREGKERYPLITPDDLVKRLIPISKNNLVGLVFGSEREGLTNKELSLCHLYSKIPTSEAFPSINLSQAVMIFCYELFKSKSNITKKPKKLALSEQLEGMFEHMERTLLNIGFLEPKNPKRMMRVLRRIFGRSVMDEREIRIIHGIWSKVDLLTKQKRS